ncbi:plastocyanin/azurin family copper-binding protein [Haloarchaeobius sp. DT45]|uniref:plastocyanin/azurin family copper-binding protein n=1 Tax=Haloarchaeobius sp. DT45 TaxID=3446116 RepID=UPI003F6C15A3
MTQETRRRFLAGGLASGLALALAGCFGGGDEDGSGGGDGTDDPTAESTQSATPTATSTTQVETEAPTTAELTTTGEPTTSGEQTVVAVGPGGDFVFTPERLSVPTGTTVRFEWRSAGHTVSPTSQPDGADWAGVDDTKGSGFTHEHTFDVAGTYEYHCKPHQSLGMTGAIVVD